MMTMNGWRLEVPDCGRAMGYEGENLSRRVMIQTDALEGPAYFLDMEFSDGTAAALPLELEGGVLYGELTRDYLSVPGPAAVTVRAVDGARVRKSNMEMLYIADAAGEGEPLEPEPAPGGATDHRQLTHRDAEGQHPIGAIEGLDDQLRRIPAPAEALTNLELEELLK